MEKHTNTDILYKNSGVDIEAGYRSNELIKKHVDKTMNENVIGGLGGFGGMFSLGCAKSMEEPILISGTDGVGTKLKLAFLMDKHDTIGIDCVAMCVNDVLCSGAKPLFFLDYCACGKNYPEKIEQIVKGVAQGCLMAGAALIGGETAEMPGFYPDGEYDLAGFCVGIVDKPDMIDGKNITSDNIIIGLESSGLHSNGYSLSRNVFNINEENISIYYDELGMTIGECLITPTKIYAKAVERAVSTRKIKGIANITGGGFIENIPRIYNGVTYCIHDGTWPVPPIFQLLMDKGGISRKEMFNIFNMGIGMVMVVDKADAALVQEQLRQAGENSHIIGEIKPYNGKEIEIC